ncbi:MAG TPA: CHAT domain-containing protein [Leptolyngbyaceae cyanobacterium M33_DOE_097]|uniref:CHAT domain-containing protein n=1 Tax=Oscillatoriales cyanobacterium SpSt-418 TaxID=2282169 RepID=A0A7C3KI24_9CYAN|nr:CHAT domain-containing protein [Leptolyngbyaceae cyanobacterium M33_DOE_097]
MHWIRKIISLIFVKNYYFKWIILGVTFFLLIFLLSPGSAQQIPGSHATQLAALEQQARQAYDTGRFTQAIQLWQELAIHFQKANDQSGEAMALSNLSLTYQQLGRWKEAKDAIATGLARLQAADSKNTEWMTIYAQALDVQGKLQFSQGQAEAALNTWEQATKQYTQLRDEQRLIRSLINQAQALQTLGYYERAKDTIQKANQALQAEPDSLLKAIALRSLGNILRLTGDLQESQTVLQQSLAIAQILNNAQAMSEAWLNLGNTARARGLNQIAVSNPEQAEKDFQAAIEAYKQAAAISTAPLLRLQSQLNHFSLLVERQQFQAAIALQSQLQPLFEDLPANRDAIYARINHARALLKLVEYDQQKNTSLLAEAERILEVAVQQANVLGDYPTEAYAIGTLGQVYQAKGAWSEAQNFTQKALLQAQVIGASDSLYQWQWQMGRLLRQQGATEQAITAYTQAVDTLQSLRGDLVAMNPEVQFSFREDVEPVYREFIDLLLQDKNPSQAYLKQARTVTELLQLAEVENYLRQACIVPKEPVDQILDQQDQQAAAIYPIILRDRVEVIVKLPQQAELLRYSTAISQTQVEATLASLRHTLLQPETFYIEEAKTLSKQVYDWLLQPSVAKLEQSGIQTLVFILDGSLRNIPMAALHDGQQYLIEKYSLALTPGLQLTAPTPLQNLPLNTLAVGISEARSSFSELKNVPIELSNIQAKVPSQVLLNQQFTEQAFRQQVNSQPYSVVHLATHGQFSSNLENTFILAWDKVIRVNELSVLFREREYKQPNAIELLVLSACQTATGDNRAALGIAGVAIRAGARSTVASLWSVQDESTALLMTQFYQQLSSREVTKAEALRQSQLFLLRHSDEKYQHPAIWAPYILLGNWL